MNKTVTVNLGGTVFHIDDNAYESLIRYLNAIKGHFSAEQGRDEIMQDIESRIGEMFRERMKDGREVITLNDVTEVTNIMGRPEEFAGAEEEKSSAGSADNANIPSGKVKKRFFRNPDEKFVGGVCSGIAAYFDIDPVWIRLIFACALIFYGTGFWIYILLWIIIPEAKTTADRLMMRGEPVTVSNIEKNVREELDALKERLKEKSKATTVVGRMFETIGEVIKFIFLVLGKVIAAFFVIIAIIIGVAMLASLFGLVGAPFVHLPGFIHHMFNTTAHFSWIYFGVVLLIAIPALMLAYSGVRFLFNIKKSSRILGYSALGAWLIALIIVLITGFGVFRDFREKDSFRKIVSIQQPGESRYLVLATDESKNSERDYDYGGGKYYGNIDDDFYLESSGDKLMSRSVKLDVVKSPTDSFDLVEIFYAQGESRKAAIDNASRISYSFTQVDSVIRFNRHFSLDQDDKWRAQRVQLLLRVPVGARVRFDETLHHFIYDVDNIKNIYDADMINRTWEMTERGLSCVDCDGTENTIGGDIDITDEDTRIRIDDQGVHISNDEGDKVVIDSTGIYVRDGGKEVVKISSDEAKKAKK